MNDTDQTGTEPAAPAVSSGHPDDAPGAAVPQRTAPSLVTLVTDPRAFFDALEGGPVSLRVPALIVFVVGVLGAITGYQMSSVVINALDIPGMEGLGSIMGAIGAISALIVVFLLWVVYTAVFFVISMAFKGRGDFNRLLAYVGYSRPSRIIRGAVSLVLTWSYLSNLRVPSLTDPAAIQEWTQSLLQNPTMQPVSRAQSACSSCSGPRTSGSSGSAPAGTLDPRRRDHGRRSRPALPPVYRLHPGGLNDTTPPPPGPGPSRLHRVRLRRPADVPVSDLRRNTPGQ